MICIDNAIKGIMFSIVFQLRAFLCPSLSIEKPSPLFPNFLSNFFPLPANQFCQFFKICFHVYTKLVYDITRNFSFVIFTISVYDYLQFFHNGLLKWATNPRYYTATFTLFYCDNEQQEYDCLLCWIKCLTL